MKTKKIIAAMMVVGLMAPATIAKVFATDGTGETPVTYDNRTYIPDPDHPDAPEWAVTIPSSISFTDDNKDIDTTVELVTLRDGAVLPAQDITVSVTSQNNYKLKNGSAEISYKLIYGQKEMSKDVTEIAKLKDTVSKQSGHAVLGNDKTPARGSYTDTLTYTISTSTQP